MAPHTDTQTETAPPRTRGRGSEVLPDAVLETLRKTHALHDDDIDALWEAAQNGEREPARLLGVTPAIANTLEHAALGLYRSGQHAKACAAYGFLLEAVPARASAWRGLGACQQALRSYGLAVAAYLTAKQLDPQDLATHVLLGECYILLGQRAWGVQALTDALTIAPRGAQDRVYHARAQAILAAQAEAPATPAAADALPARVRAEAAGHGEAPAVQALLARLGQAVAANRVTIRQIAGFTDAQMEAAYVAACRYLDMEQPLTCLQLAGWLMYIDARDGRYYALAGLAAQHLRLWCLADYLYGCSLLYRPGHAITMVYHGEAKIFSDERHAGVALLHAAVARLGPGAEEQQALLRAKALLKQFDNAARRAPP